MAGLKACIISVLIVWILLGFRVPAHSQAPPSGTRSDSQKIDVTADQLTVGDSGTQIEAKGSVVIKREETTLKAEEVRVNRETQDVEARGNISVDDPEWKVKSAQSMQFNLEKETGEIQRGDLFIEQGHVSIMGQRFQKFGGQTYHVDEGFFTTCLCESGPPSWKFSADQMDLTPEGMGIIRNGYLYIMDVPVFYGKIGDTLKQEYTDTSAWLITSDFEQGLKNVGLRTSRKIKVFNGKLECRFVKYEMYSGSRKRNKTD